MKKFEVDSAIETAKREALIYDIRRKVKISGLEIKQIVDVSINTPELLEISYSDLSEIMDSDTDMPTRNIEEISFAVNTAFDAWVKAEIYHHTKSIEFLKSIQFVCD